MSNILIFLGQGAQYGQHRVISNIEYPATDLPDTLPWICPEVTGATAEAPK